MLELNQFNIWITSLIHICQKLLYPLFTTFYFWFRLHHLALKREQKYYIVCYISIWRKCFVYLIYIRCWSIINYKFNASNMIVLNPMKPQIEPQGLAVIFSHRQVYVKREGRTLFLLPKVKVEFRHLLSLQKRFSLCSYHNINANIVVFCWLTGLQ
jgi:hypothetical protein